MEMKENLRRISHDYRIEIAQTYSFTEKQYFLLDNFLSGIINSIEKNRKKISKLLKIDPKKIDWTDKEKYKLATLLDKIT